ncbi:hypothetical protein FVEG_12695 [Fusarium verticillioides 7600]|uniref:Uncharacterized protein n=1 Tax=Gibberella moniliformis (strain M3125 / FGSC 7600) TaxID=334819 RepID=W7N2V4_GIBM7|nr:hypothetical protein FVEG_12695 [Fusarium verticillioides 7600]EWG54485.1 hypothetical protein FVEG_12695 [Fusarium verticillioides 7600]
MAWCKKYCCSLYTGVWSKGQRETLKSGLPIILPDTSSGIKASPRPIIARPTFADISSSADASLTSHCVTCSPIGLPIHHLGG